LKPFGGLCEKQGSYTSQAHFSMNFFKNGGAFCILFPGQIGYMLKIFTSFESIQHIGKK